MATILEQTGVGLLSYNSLAVLAVAAKALDERTPAEIPLIIYDDASYQANVRWARAWAESVERDVAVTASGVNRGAAYGRNRMLEAFEAQGKRFVATVDTDIEVLDGWLEALAEVMAAHDDCGIATWRYCNEHGGRFPIAEDGRVAEAASMCWLWRLDAVDAALGPDVVWGMDERLALLSHDSEFCQRMKRCSGYRVYVSAADLMREIEQHHSLTGASATVNGLVRARRALDCKIWQELEAARGWAAGKEWTADGPFVPEATKENADGDACDTADRHGSRPRAGVAGEGDGEIVGPPAVATMTDATPPVANVEEAPMGRYILARATDPKVLEAASSGGLVRTFLAGAVKVGMVDCLVVTRGGRSDTGTNAFRPEVVVVEASEAAAFVYEQAFGSVYLPSNPFPALRRVAADARIGTVLLPCQARRLRELQAGRLHPFLRFGAGDPPAEGGELANVVLTVELACNRVPSRRWVMAAVQRHFGVPPAEVVSLDFRAGAWPGSVEVIARSGEIKSMPYLKFWGGIEAPTGDCARCRVPFTRFCDVVAADSWGLEALTGGQPATLACLHSRAAQTMVDELAEGGALWVKDVTKDDFFRSMSAMLADKRARGAVNGD